MQELFSPLACGGKLVLAAPGGEKDTQYLARLKASQGVTFCIYVPSQLDAALQVGTRFERHHMMMCGRSHGAEPQQTKIRVVSLLCACRNRTCVHAPSCGT